MKRWWQTVRWTALAAVMAGLMVVSGCEGTESRNQVEDTAEELAGRKQVDRMHEMKKELEQIQAEQAKRIDQIEDSQ